MTYTTLHVLQAVLPFFFRPSPSRLSPGRNTVFVPLNELCKVLYVPHWESKESVDQYTVRHIQTEVSNRKKTNENKQNTHTTKTEPNTPKQTPYSEGRAQARGAAYVPRAAYVGK